MSKRRVVGLVLAGLVAAACAPIPPPPPPPRPPPPPPPPARIEVTPNESVLSDTPGGLGDSQIFTIANVGGSWSEEVLWFVLVNDGIGQFELVEDTCSGALAPGTSCYVEVRYTNDAGSGELLGDLVVSATPDDDPLEIWFMGLGEPGGIEIDRSSAQLVDTPDVPFGIASFIVTNTSGRESPFAVSLLDIAGTGTFSLDRVPMATPALHCADYPNTHWRPGQSCRIDVRYANPSGAGTGSATLEVNGGPAGSVSADLTGSVGDEPLSLDVHTAWFGDWPTQGGSAPQTITVTNDGATSTGTLGVRVWDLQRSISSDGRFGVLDDTCGQQSLNPGASCSFTLTYTNDYWNGKGEFAALVFDETGPGGTVFATLHGEGLAGFDVRVQYNLAHDGPQTADGYAEIWVRHQGSGPSEPLEVVLTDTPGLGTWAIANPPSGAPCVGRPLQPSQTCTVRIRYRNDTGSGSSTASVRISTGSTQPAVQVTLYGTGHPDINMKVNQTDVVLEDSPSSPGTTHTIELKNEGSAPIHYEAISADAPYGTGSFVLLGGDCLGRDRTFAPGASCSLTYRYENDTGSGSRELIVYPTLEQLGFIEKFSVRITGIGVP